MVEETLLNVSNPGQAVFGLGLALTAGFALAGYTDSWQEERSAAAVRSKVSAPIVVWIVVALSAALTLAALAHTG